MKILMKLVALFAVCATLSGCLVTSVVGVAASAVGTAVGTAVDVVDAVTPDLTDD